MPTVSTVIPCYNGSEWIDECIHSALEQSFSDLEVIVVDDGSEDDSTEIVRSIDDERLQLINHPENRGIAAARNTGIQRADGEYIAFLDQDDYWHKEKIEKQLKAIDQSDKKIGVVYGDVCAIEKKEQRMSAEPLPTDPSTRTKKIFIGNPIYNITSLISKKCFESHGLLDESLYGTDDYEFYLRIAKNYEFEYIPNILAYKRSHSRNASGNVDRMTRDKIKIAEEYTSKHPELSDKLDNKICGSYLIGARNYFHSGKYTGMVWYIMNSMNVNSKFTISKITRYMLSKLGHEM